jgi:hypothetical protein
MWHQKDDKWCYMVTQVKRRKPKRFTVSVEPSEYHLLIQLAQGQHPRVPLQYVVHCAIIQYLQQETAKRGAVQSSGNRLEDNSIRE